MTTPAPRGSTGHVRRPQRRQLSRLIVLLLLTLVAGVGLAGTASAHNVLTSSDPTDGSTLQTAPTRVRLTFDQPVQDFEPVVTVIGPDGQRYESGSPVVDSTEVTAAVGTLPSAGSYTIAYRVVSADGHPVQGEIRFELADGSGGSAVATSGSADPSSAGSPVAAPETVISVTSTSSTSVAVAPVTSSTGLSGWVWAAIALAAILIAAAVVVIVRKPRLPD